MAQRIYQERGQDGRSVLGMLAVQVEKDPKTGVTIVRSVTPVSGAPGPQTASTIFDDGRKSIHAVGASAAQPSSEELGQILSAIDGVGMTALLDDVAMTPGAEDVKRGQGKVLSDDQAPSTVNFSKGPIYNEKGRIENVPKTIASTEVRQKTLVIDSSPKVEVAESEMLCDGPVTLMFMGYTDGRADGDGSGAEEPQGMLTAERVIITDDGEELVLGQGSATPSHKSTEDTAAQKATNESQSKPVFHDVPLEGKDEQAPRQGDDAGQKSVQQKSESVAEGQGKPKRKNCQCCTVM